jgi:DNA (cytosine-5)-methyltransferase 1
MTFVPEVGFGLNAHGGTGRSDIESETFIASGRGYWSESDEAPALGTQARALYESTVVAHALRADGFDASEDGTGRGTPLVPIGFYANDSGNDAGEDIAPTLRSMEGGGGNHPAVAFTERGRDQGRTFECQEDIAYCLTNPGSGGRTHSRQIITPQMAVRRLTPRECERLQGFPDDYTAVPYRKVSQRKLEADYLKYLMRGGTRSREDCFRLAADGPRYKALGNSWAVPVPRWIGARIELVDSLLKGERCEALTV